MQDGGQSDREVNEMFAYQTGTRLPQIKCSAKLSSGNLTREMCFTDLIMIDKEIVTSMFS